ncbi:amidohydrolase family protein [Massilia yuzhufengensis]|uniref:Amidohydrolase n=1 Tax=Massilia yuzhufengensis TaxID=1164594 RepID=A0A1I1J927_9BURK|nr:amidohydrolase family protein [Massilia yuzhufengensis]SFC45119.1 Amidohydrolase [Massilia yuzhufengensis]
MRRVPILLCTALALASAGLAAAAPAAPVRAKAVVAMPVADHHQYVFSPAAAAFMSTATAALRPVTAQELIPQLDAAGIERAAVLSVAYVYGQPLRSLDEEYRRVRAENDWAARQAAEYPDRLVALCSVDPLKKYALAELARCAANPEFGRGIKLQPAAGGIVLDDEAQVDQVRRVFRSANARGMTILLQLRGTGAEQARLLIEQLLPHAPDVPVQVAYTGEADDSPQQAALAVLADAAARQDPRMRQVWFDVTAFARPGLSQADARHLVRRMRQVGMDRVLYGSDTVIGADQRPQEAWAAFRNLPLTDAEAARVASNVMSYLR